MARVVRTAIDCGLQVVGQVHTHPGKAFHSAGDDDGARIAYTGFISIVIPDYGRNLPELTRAATYVFIAGKGFVEIHHPAITVVGGSIP